MTQTKRNRREENIGNHKIALFLAPAKIIIGSILLLFGGWLVIFGKNTIIPAVKIGSIEISNAPFGVIIIVIGIAVLTLWRTSEATALNGGQIVALIFAILLLLPGACFLWVGIHGPSVGNTSPSPPLLTIAVVILVLAALLFWVGFRRRRGRSDPQ